MSARARNAKETIAFYSVATHLGGAERSLLDLVARLEDASQGRYRPWLVLPKGEGELVEALRKEQVAFSVVPMPEGLLELSRKGWLRAPVRGLRTGVRLGVALRDYLNGIESALRGEEACLMHTTGIKCHGLSALVARRSGIPVLWHLRDILEGGPTYWALRGLQSWSGAHLLANSRATADAFIAAPGRISVVHNGLDPAGWQKPVDESARASLRAKLGVGPGERLVGIVGVLARWKGQLEFLRAAAALLRTDAKLRFAVVGGEIYDTTGDRGYGLALQNEARALGIADRVSFTGHVRDPGNYIQAMDIAVHASLRPEPFGRVIIEAMAIGTPIVAASAGGVLEIVEDRSTGLLYPPGDTDAMARAVRTLLDDAGLCGKLRAAAKDAFLARFTVDRYVEGIIGEYDRLLPA